MNLKHKLLLLLSVAMFATSCKKDEWLKEKPLDFYSPDNSFQTPADFVSALARVYLQTGTYLNSNNDATLVLQYPSDVAYDVFGPVHELNSYRNALVPENGRVREVWVNAYQIIFNCNVIISRIDNPVVKFTSEKERLALKAEAAFLRGYAYRLLGILYGGVPIVLEELSAPKRDFVRATRDEVWNQVVADYKFAETNLPKQSELKQDGRLTKAAAQHALTEIYIIKKEWDNAIASATAVIGSPDYSLMATRFGGWKDKPGDVYYDLFRRGNVNYRAKNGTNRESIWVDQYEYLVPGSGHQNFMVRFLGPLYWQLVGDDGKNLFIGPSTHMGGRGIGWLVPTDYVLNTIWDDTADIRTSQYNIIRDVKADNPASGFFGKYIVKDKAFTKFNNTFNRWWSAIFVKSTPINDFPIEVIANPATGLTTGGAQETFNDTYHFRLAETHLLRAEAYFGKGDASGAAGDINTLRARAKAKPVTAAQINLDFILDERARELHFEEHRVLTLMRLGLHQQRVDKYNIMSKGEIIDRNKLWPIPQSEIERNTEARLAQNPGY